MCLSMETKAVPPRFFAPAGPDRALPFPVLYVARSRMARVRYLSLLAINGGRRFRIRPAGQKKWRGQRFTSSGDE